MSQTDQLAINRIAQSLEDIAKNGGGSGGGGDRVEITPTLSEGTKIANFSINGEEGELYAPQGGGGKELISVSIPADATSEQINEAINELVSAVQALSEEEIYKTYIVYDDKVTFAEMYDSPLTDGALKIVLKCTGMDTASSTDPELGDVYEKSVYYSADTQTYPAQYDKYNLCLTYFQQGTSVFRAAEMGRVVYEPQSNSHSMYLEKKFAYDNDNGGGDQFPECTFTLYSL